MGGWGRCCTRFQLPIIGVKKNPNSPLYTQLGVITKGTVIEVRLLYLLPSRPALSVGAPARLTVCVRVARGGHAR